MAESLYTNNLDLLALLCLSKQNDLTCAEIRKEIQAISHNLINIPENLLRTILYRLKESGYVTLENMLLSARNHMRKFHIEESGREKLANLQEEFCTLLYVINEMLRD